MTHTHTAWKVFKYGVISGPNTGKYGPEITPYLDTFHALRLFRRQRKVVHLKNLKVSKKGSYNFLQILAKKNLALVPFSKDGRLTANMYIFWPNIHLEI